MFCAYQGDDITFNGRYLELNRMLSLYKKVTTRDTSRHRVLPALEDTLTQLLRRVSEDYDPANYEFRWFLANRKEFLEIFAFLSQERERLQIPRPVIDIEPEYQRLQALLRDTNNLYDTTGRVRRKAGNLTAAKYAILVGGTSCILGGSATGVSAFSFFGGPVVGSVVTGSTAIGSVTIGTAATTASAIIGKVVGPSNAIKSLENGLRNEIRNRRMTQ